VDNPLEYPDPSRVESADEPYIKASIITPTAYLGNVMSICIEKRGVQQSMSYLDEKRVEIVFEMPLAEVLFEFYDKLKSSSRGYASFDYDVTDYKPTQLAKLDILLNGKPVDALSQLVYGRTPTRGRRTFAKSSRRSSRVSSSRSRSRAPSAPRSSPARPSTLSVRTCSLNATEGTSAGSGSSSRSRRKARSG
jgi:translation elongation factor EF-4